MMASVHPSDHVLLCAPESQIARMTGKERDALAFEALVERVRSEFLEMPGLRLTLPQAARLWGLDLTACEAVVDALVRCEFLHRTASGSVARFEG